ncbi:MAG TPA: peptidase S8 [Caldilineae bacterium]|nr:peptidase S8 [Caldilineae bacterium]
MLILLMSWWLPVADAGPMRVPTEGEFVPGEVLVQWRTGVSKVEAQALLAEVEAERIATIDALRIDRWHVGPGREQAVISRLRSDPRVVFAELNYIARAAGVPNDPEYPWQWNMEQISAPNAWDLTTGDPNLVIAIIDSGVDIDHPDLASRLQGGWDYVRDDAIPDDEYGHGTHVAGIIGALTDNGLGVAGLTWQGRLVPYKVLDQTGRGSYADIAAAIVSAAEQGARIINLSLGGSVPSQTLLNAVNYAYNAGALVVAATGNNNGPVNYPAAYPQVVAVAATTDLDRHAWYSNFGPEVDVAAPGGLPEQPIFSTVPDGYGFLYGTSMAAAHVSGLAALIWSLAPQLSSDDVRRVIESTTEQVDAASHPYIEGHNDYLGRGRINAEMALRSVLPPYMVASPGELVYVVAPSETPPPRPVYLMNPSLQPIHWEAEVLAGRYWLGLRSPISGTLAYPSTATLSVAITTTAMISGTYVGLVRVTGSSSTGGQQLDIYVRARVMEKVHRLYVPDLR